MVDTAVKPETGPLHGLSLATADVLHDYRLAYLSRQASYAGRREVMGGKAKFGIFGDGKEVAQLALARALKPGDFRSGYYRDQTLLLATGETTLEAFFAQLYAHADVEAEPASGGRAMNAHFGSRLLEPDGSWKDLTRSFVSSSDVSPTGSQMPRLVGLAYASHLYRELDELKTFTRFSHNGDEIAVGTIGNASTAEGMFWEAVNAIGVLQSPALIAIYDDEYGISVPNEQQMLKHNLSELLSGFQREPGGEGYDIYTVRGWDYPALVNVFARAAETARRQHVPAIVHVIELTQPQGHSTSGSHERYKSKERLAWEQEFDCVSKMRGWMVAEGLATPAELDALEAEARREVEASRKLAWEAYLNPIRQERRELLEIIAQAADPSPRKAELQELHDRLRGLAAPLRRDLYSAQSEALLLLRQEQNPAAAGLMRWKQIQDPLNEARYGSHLYTGAALQTPAVPPVYSGSSPTVYGFEVLNACFDAALQREPRLIAFGEDVGRLGDVNQGLRGLQEKYGELRVSDTGIREATILGTAIGLALRGLRPLAEIQYLDYLLYALQLLSDDLATLHWRTAGGQKAPVILRTRGHRLEGIWHSGSPMGGILHLVRGVYVLVPRNMTQAAGFYNTLLLADEPALVVEALNGYRLKERVPDNIAEFTLPLGVPEVLRTGEDLTIVTYGSTCRIVMSAAERLARVGIQAEVIDVQTLLPFDRPGAILDSLKKTGRVLFVDEDVPGGASAYMLQQVLETREGYRWLDSPPRTLTGTAHRPAYGSDGDYFSKPNVETVFEMAYEMLHETDPQKYPLFYRYPSKK